MLQAPLTYLAAFIVAIGLLVVVHEFGHFYVARRCGVKVLRFSVGFGRVLWSRRFGADATELTLCAIPLGGYVKMLDEREGPVAEVELERAFTRKTLGQRSLIVLAGPLANLLLAIALYWGLFMHGVEELRPLLATPPAASAAAHAGLQGGDTVLAVNQREIRSWEELRWEMLRLVGDTEQASLEVLSQDGVSRTLRLNLQGLTLDEPAQDPLQALGLSIAPPRLPPVIGRVIEGSPAAVAGFQADDLIVAINDGPVDLWSEVATRVRNAPEDRLRFTLERQHKLIELDLIPRLHEEKGRRLGRAGFAPRDEPALRAAMFTMVSHAPGRALLLAARQTWETSIFTLRMIGRMVLGELSLRNLSGPVTIAEYAGQSVQLGFPYYIKFLALISISIGVLNLLPIPVLDGGHLMYYLAEFLHGKPLPEAVFAIGQRIGLALLLLMMSVALFNDLNRQFFG